jgi:hypothetical protein
MDSGLLHLAGTTNTPIIQLGSSLNPEFRMPHGHPLRYVDGPCKLQCCSNMKYGVKEWGNIQGVQPLIGCLENKETFECHPEVNQVYEEAINYISSL